MVDHRGQRDPPVRRGNDDCAYSFARSCVRKAEHGCVGDVGMAQEHLFDFAGRDVLTIADDDVLQAPGDGDVSVIVDGAEISGPEPAGLIDGVRVECGVDVAEESLRGP